ncbi:MAG: glutamate--tRNA ligase [Thermoanaerobaculia bacterium]|nr:glutamate--tRNA ligase [Thermoanaerobaculia bacterium]
MSPVVQGPVRVRFAPSPTGYLHVGGARTAIYNDLLRQAVGGAFVLRIEDTDRERSDEAMTRQIQEGLAWVGVPWDEGPFLQSDRLERHRTVAEELLAAGLAYQDFRTPAELAELRERAHAEGATLKSLAPEPSEEEVERRLAAGDPHVLRFRMPEETIRFRDLVRGEVEFAPETQEDLVILRSDGSPTYHLSVVCDDVDMEITHVVRGEDHLSNTPKHVALFRALGADVPAFAHLPLILGQDKKRLSKRTGAASVEEFREAGILPQALYNYLALLGWSPEDDREILSREEMIAEFSLGRIGSSASVFDPDKLSWTNAQYMSSLPLEELLEHLRPFLPGEGLEGVDDEERLREAVELHRSRARDLRELAGQIRIYFADVIEPDEALSRKYLTKDPELAEHLEILADRYEEAETFDLESIEEILRGLADEVGVKAGALIHPTRMALTGVKAGPSLFDLVAVMGREATVRHLRRYAEYVGDLS